jgi:hypothetical protein
MQTSAIIPEALDMFAAKSQAKTISHALLTVMQRIWMHFTSNLMPNLVPRARVPFGQHRETRGSGRNDFLVHFDWFWLDNG